VPERKEAAQTKKERSLSPGFNRGKSSAGAEGSRVPRRMGKEGGEMVEGDS